MFKHLQKLKLMEFTPTAILDIGAYNGSWTKSMLEIYNDCEYYIFEANDYETLDTLGNFSNVRIYKNIILNDKIEEVEWYSKESTGDSFFKEKTIFYEHIIPSKRKTIDLNTFLKNNNVLQDDVKDLFIKIDCQGAEIAILKGSSNILSKTAFILLEIPFFGQYNENVPNFLEHIKFMDSIDFIPYDIVDHHYINNFNMQIDMLFIHRKHHFNSIVQERLFDY
jgi:FkbM family methyltransferase